MDEVYAVQNVVNTEIRLWERHLATQVKDAHQDLRRLKSEIREVKQRKLEVDGNYWRLSGAVTLACGNLAEEEITLELATDAKIT